jgi:uncharacterized caspase-like protein
MLHAVLIGIDRYRDPDIPDLWFARSDAETFASLLIERILPAERRVVTLLDERATRQAIVTTLVEELPRQCSADDVVLIYFAGHGSPERTSPRDDDWPYLIAHDTDYQRIAATGIDMNHDVAGWLEGLPARLAVLFLDACFSGNAGGRTLAGPTFLAHRNRFRDEPISLQSLELGEGRIIIAAADDDEVAEEVSQLGHGVFTYHLLDVLGQAPAAGSATIGVGTLYELVARKVRDATRGAQRPVSVGRSVGGALPLLGRR